MPVTPVTDADFAAATSSGVVFVDFYADWCGPCQSMMPVVEEVAEEYEGKVKVVKINIDNNKETAQKFGVMSIPTFKVLKDGKEVGSLTGTVGKEKLTEALDSAIG